MKRFWKRWIALSMAGLILAAGAVSVSLFSSCNHKDHKAAETKGQMYHCPMHPNYISDKPGKCPICGMDLVPMLQNEGASAGSMGEPAGKKERKILYYRDAMNPAFKSDKAGKAPDGMDLVPVYEEEAAGNVVRINPDMVQAMGVKTEKAQVRTLSKEVRANANITADERRIYSVTSRISGYIEKLYANYTGQRVKKDQPLFDVFSSDLVSAQNEYLSALKRSTGPGNSEDPIAQSALKRLRNWNLPESEIKELEATRQAKRVLTLRSPADGIVTEKPAVEGQAIEPGMTLYRIVDYSNVWAICDVYQQDAPFVKLGQKAELTIDYLAGHKFSGVVTYISPEVNRESRTLSVRIELSNTPDLLLKPGMAATARLFASSSRAALVSVSDAAVIRSGLRAVVIIAKGEGAFEPREVKIGISADGYTEILAGVSEGEEVVTSSQFLIDSESNLKAAVLKLAPPSSDSGTQSPAKPVPVKPNPGQLYTCPMHPEVVKNKPGECPICGMDLVPKH
jgi:membrane fusion protein, copper/silver efflux system